MSDTFGSSPKRSHPWYIWAVKKAMVICVLLSAASSFAMRCNTVSAPPFKESVGRISNICLIVKETNIAICVFDLSLSQSLKLSCLTDNT